MANNARGLAIGCVLAATAIGFAGQASAEALSGQYMRNLGGLSVAVTFTPCGPDCTHLDTGGVAYDLHLQGNTWTGSYPLNSGTLCTVAIDNNTLLEKDTCGSDAPIPMQLTKIG